MLSDDLTGARRAAVVGSPIAHSLSPLLHRAAYDALELAGWTFDRHEISGDGLASFVAGIETDERWRGLTVTMPLKEEALALADAISPTARATGAANTLVRTTTGWNADNTDVHGIRAALIDAGVAAGSAESAVILGSGATARSALAALAQLEVRSVTLVVRDQAREQTMGQAHGHGFAVQVGRFEQFPDLQDTARRAAVLVSTLPAGAADALAPALAQIDLAGAVLLDVVYAGWPTTLAGAARARGATVVPGIEMLIHQAAEQVRLMTGHAPPLVAMQAAGRAAQRPSAP